VAVAWKLRLARRAASFDHAYEKLVVVNYQTPLPAAVCKPVSKFEDCLDVIRRWLEPYDTHHIYESYAGLQARIE